MEWSKRIFPQEMDGRYSDSSEEETNSETQKSESIKSSSSEIWKLLNSIKQGPSSARERPEDVPKSGSDKGPSQAIRSVPGVKRTEESPSVSVEENLLYLDPRDIEIKKNYLSLNMDVDNKFYDNKLKFSDPAAQDDAFDGDDAKETIWCRYSKIAVMSMVWVLCTIILITKKEKISSLHQISIPPSETKTYLILDRPTKNHISVVLEGALLPNYYANLTSRWMTMWVEKLETRVALELSTPLKESHITHSANITEFWTIPLVSEELIDIVPEIKVKKTFELIDYNPEQQTKSFIRFHFQTNLNSSFPISVDYDLSPIDLEDGVVYAALVLFGLYVFIIFEIVHRTLAAMLAATMSVAILAALDERPSISDIASWIDSETLLLLFSMMVMVAIFSETGIFDYLSVYTYKITNGRVWPLINTLCFFTAFLSSFLDNVTTALLMTPVTIRLCEVMELNPVPVLMAMMIFSNIGGAITPVGDPPNVIVASHPEVINAGVDFGVFFLHMFLGVAIVSAVVYCQLRIMFRHKNVFRYAEPQDVQDLRHEIAVWQRAAASLSSYSKDEGVVRETLLKKARRLLSELKMKLLQDRAPYENYKTNLEELQEKYPITNWPLLYKSSFALMFVICVFFLHSIPELNLSLGCTAFLGAVLLLVLADRENMEGVLARVEWSTLLFFASLFILMEALSRLRLIEWIGRKTEQLILGVEPDYQLSVAIVLILWVSACASAFVDNIPLTTMMIRIVTSLAQNPQLGLPLMPLVWALCFGACLGGVATLIGSSSNVVCAGVAEQHGYRFTFVEYFKVGFPVMIVSVSVCTVYLMIAHVALGWNT
ncbi:UNVERIFIED_CONTAM: hypothetical protein PYX00_004364 [Menopon gallinae]|uniref:Citrate transporter-like domain-containing protein n=1 Tax=Menopon gallinae TaxID=328185 RepID=A0AAW2I3W8_9NEOP